MLWRSSRSSSEEASESIAKTSDERCNLGKRITKTSSRHSRNATSDWQAIEDASSQESQSPMCSPFTPISESTANTLSAKSMTFSILSAFEKSAGRKKEQEDDTRIVMATREDMDWSYPFLLRRSQIPGFNPPRSDRDDSTISERTQRCITQLSPHIGRHIESDQPTNIPSGVRRNDKPLRTLNDVAHTRSDQSSLLPDTQPRRKVDPTFKRTKSAPLNQVSLRTSYFHHNTLRRHNSTGNFSRPRAGILLDK